MLGDGDRRKNKQGGEDSYCIPNCNSIQTCAPAKIAYLVFYTFHDLFSLYSLFFIPYSLIFPMIFAHTYITKKLHGQTQSHRSLIPAAAIVLPIQSFKPFKIIDFNQLITIKLSIPVLNITFVIR